MFWIGNLIINEYHFVFKVKNDTILLHGFDTKNKVILWFIILIVLNDIRLYKEPFAIRILKKISLISTLRLV
jgi:hypothetical protein